MSAHIDLSDVQTEGRNPNSINIDKVDTIELCSIINREDRLAAAAVDECIPIIAAAVDGLVNRVRNNGRVFYVGAGTSGRLGVLDASELPPTYAANPDQFIALIAGGDAALRHAQEGAEDDAYQAVRDLEAQGIDGDKDALIGIAASGRTPYVLSCLQHAKTLGCVTVGVACSSPSAMSKSGNADFMIEAVTGSEVVTGSTRMKAGTATKMILNILSTGVMIKMGKTYGNMMVDLRATNLKLKQRARNILRQLCGSVCPQKDSELDHLLQSCDGSVKLAIAVLKLQVPVVEAKQALEHAGGVLAVALEKSTLVEDAQEPSKSGFDSSNIVLFVDGGATKCAATIITEDGTVATGSTGGCNMTELGPVTAMDQIVSATKQALSSVECLASKDLQSITFHRVWIGLAGYDRPDVAAKMDSLIRQTFKITSPTGLKISNDIDLVATAAAEEAKVETAVVLTAGTGSIAMGYARTSDGLQRIGRVGGYGYLLGDEGSAFDIGRQGIKHALDEIAHVNGGLRLNGSQLQFSILTQRILKHFGEDVVAKGDLLSAIMSPSNHASTTADIKWKIAGTARTVVEAASVCEFAAAIIRNATIQLADLVNKVVFFSKTDVSQSILILTGGLMQNDHFQKIVMAEITKTEKKFKEYTLFLQPSVQGATFLHKLAHR